MNYKNKEDLEEQYINRQLGIKECSEVFGCSTSTIHYWLKKHGIETRPAVCPRRVGCTFYTTDKGYEWWVAGTKGVGIHQLLVIANGADPHKVFSGGDYEVHHKNTIQWDNRPENIELVSRKEHNEIHTADEWVDHKVLGCKVLDSPSRYGHSNRKSVRSRYANPEWYHALG